MKKRSIIIIILIFGISFITCYFFTTKKDKKTIETSNKEITTKEKNIKDIEIKEELSKLINNLEGFDYCIDLEDYEYKNGCLYQFDKISNKNLTFEYKLYSFILNNQSDLKQKEEEIKINDHTELVKANIGESEIKENYEKIYGTEESFNPEKINEIPNSNIIFDNIKKVFYLKKEVSKKQNLIKKYQYKFTTKDDKFYVYISVAFLKLIGKDEYINYEAYRESDQINLKYEGLYNELEYFEVNKENYNEYSKYKYIFEKKANNRYEFISIEKIN